MYMCTADWESQRINVSSYHNSFNPRVTSCVPKEGNKWRSNTSRHRDSSQDPQNGSNTIWTGSFQTRTSPRKLIPNILSLIIGGQCGGRNWFNMLCPYKIPWVEYLSTSPRVWYYSIILGVCLQIPCKILEKNTSLLVWGSVPCTKSNRSSRVLL